MLRLLDIAATLARTPLGFDQDRESQFHALPLGALPEFQSYISAAAGHVENPQTTSMTCTGIGDDLPPQLAAHAAGDVQPSQPVKRAYAQRGALLAGPSVPVVSSVEQGMRIPSERAVQEGHMIATSLRFVVASFIPMKGDHA
jgi:hypothetical protein